MIDKTQAQITKGNAAKAKLLDPLFQEAVQKLKADYIAAWEATSLSDHDGRERLWTAHRLVGKVIEHLTALMNDGKIAQAQIDNIRKAA